MTPLSRSSRRSGLLAAVALFGLGCGRSEPQRPPDIVLVSIDTLRPDHLGAYSSQLPTSPHLDRFRLRGVLFREVIAQASSTLASHASLLTSMLPAQHGASFATRRPLPDTVPTLAESLAAAGYRTVAVTARGQIDPKFGLGRGFEVYRARSESKDPGIFRRRVRDALEILARPDPRPVFVFLHTYEVHHPYTPRPATLERLDPDYGGALESRISVDMLRRINTGELPIDSADARHIERAYDAEVVAVDRAFGALIQGLQSQGRADNTVVVLTSDHGEEFGEHGMMGWHSHTLYDELLRVPLIVGLPGDRGAGTEIAMPVRSIDIAPTLLELAGVPIPATFDGRSLVPLLRGEALRELPAISQLDVEGPANGGHASIRFEGWKLYGQRLFRLDADPGERDDVAAVHPEIVDRYAQLLQAALGRRTTAVGESVEIDADLERDLRALGYLN